MKTIHIGEGSGRGSGRVRLFVGNRGSGRVGSTFRRVGSGPRKVTRWQLWSRYIIVYANHIILYELKEEKENNSLKVGRNETVLSSWQSQWKIYPPEQSISTLSNRHYGLVVSAPAWDGTGFEFDSWQCHWAYDYSGPSGFSGYIWLHTKIV